jgi:predicted MPP superfamily phosphohydrolase
VSVSRSLLGALQRWRAQLAHAFFANFFRLVVLAVSLSEWGVLWWVFPPLSAALPGAAQLAAPVMIYGANRRLVLQARRGQRADGPAGTAARLYYAGALTSLFCMGFLLLTGALWIGAKVFVEAIAVEARATHASLGIDSSVNTGFRWLADVGVASIGLAFAYGYTIGQRRLRTTWLRLPLSWPSALTGLRIAHISDIHIGHNLRRDEVERFVARVNVLHPDLICITGDIADGPSADLQTFLPLLAQLRATHGVFAILGNHDHYAGAERVEGALRALTPFTILRDQHLAIEAYGQRLHLVGLDDRGRDWARGATAVPQLAAALAAIPPNEPVLLLCHRPDVFRQAADGGVALTLSGHTHGGQIGVPWRNGRVRNLAEFITPFDRGLFQRGQSYLYVNRGLGVTGQRIRLCAPREITLIEVQPPAGSGRATSVSS